MAGRVAVSLFLIWHVFAVADWNLPQTAPVVTFANPIVRPYLVATGMTQAWGQFFSPDPYALDLYVDARVRYRDGSVRVFEFPRMQHLSYWQRYGLERWRKYLEVAHQDQYNYMWPSMARFAARSANVEPNNPVVTVDLIRVFRNVQPPGSPTQPGETPQPPPTPIAFMAFLYYTYNVKPEDLR